MQENSPNLAGDEELFGDYAYGMDLERQCRPIALPVAIVAAFAWIPFAFIDLYLYPGNSLVLALRLGLSAVGICALVLLAFRRVREFCRPVLLAVFAYMNLSAAVILGLVSGDPIYLGGLSIIIIMLPMVPLGRKCTLSLLGATVAVFAATGMANGMSFDTPQKAYGLVNFIEAILITIVAAIFLEHIRRANFRAQQSLQLSNIQLQRIHLKLMEANLAMETAARELQRTNEELRQANEQKSTVIGVAAHDLKNPLQVVSGFSRLLRRRIRADAKASEQIELIISASDKMVKLIDELLDTAVIDTGHLKLVMDEFSLAPLAESVVGLNRPLAERKGQPLALYVGGDCLVKGDKLKLQRVMDNLVSNAIKFSPPGCPIAVRICHRGETEVAFEVQDRGPGLSEGDRDRVFGRFQRLSARPTGGEHSTGLGLSIVKDIVNLHQGIVEVESELGKGATFRVRLPALPGPDSLRLPSEREADRTYPGQLPSA